MIIIDARVSGRLAAAAAVHCDEAEKGSCGSSGSSG